MLNHITVMGNMVADPELKTTTTGIKVLRFRIACTRDIGTKDGGKVTDFIDCVAWRATAEFVSKYFAKGKPILVDGALHIRNWETKDGGKRRDAEIAVENVYFCGGEKAKAADPVLTDMGDADGGELPWADDDLPL